MEPALPEKLQEKESWLEIWRKYEGGKEYEIHPRKKFKADNPKSVKRAKEEKAAIEERRNLPNLELQKIEREVEFVPIPNAEENPHESIGYRLEWRRSCPGDFVHRIKEDWTVVTTVDSSPSALKELYKSALSFDKKHGTSIRRDGCSYEFRIVKRRMILIDSTAAAITIHSKKTLFNPE